MKTIATLKLTIANLCNVSEFARGRAARGALAPLASASDVLVALGLRASTSNPDRDAITLALIAEHQAGAHALWQTLLLLAYEPMLATLCRSLRQKGVNARNKEDAEQRVLLAFLEVIQKLSLAHPPSLLHLHLRHATERGVYGTDAASRQEPEIVSLSEARNETSPGDPEAPIERDDNRRRLVAELEALFGSEALLVYDVLLRARTGREPLVELVAEWYPELRARDRDVIYQRVQRLRRRSLAHLATRFGADPARQESVA